MVVNLSVPARHVKEFIALAKASPDKINMASSGSGGMPHLAGELFNMMTGIKLTHVPYKGTGAVFPDLIGGRVQVTFGDIVATIPHVKVGEAARARRHLAAARRVACPIFRRSPRAACPVTTLWAGSACSRRRKRRSRSSRSSTRPS